MVRYSSMENADIQYPVNVSVIHIKYVAIQEYMQSLCTYICKLTKYEYIKESQRTTNIDVLSSGLCEYCTHLSIADTFISLFPF